jgi:hypothetical protein
MTEYWFKFINNEPRTLYRTTLGGANERFDNTQFEWVPDDRIKWLLINGEIGYDQTTEEAAQQFIQSKLA